MSDPIIGAVLTQLGAILDEQVREELRLVVGVDRHIKNLRTTFESIQTVILDAEKKQVKDDAVRHWLLKLRDISYDMDDVLADWSLALYGLEMETLENHSPKQKVFSFISFLCFCCVRIVKRRDIAVRIKHINQELDQIAGEKDRYNLINLPNGVEGNERLKTTSYVEAFTVRGRDEDKINLVKLLLKQNIQPDSQMRLNIVSVVGMGGIGKTTLAQLACNSHEVIAHFEMRVWVVVSEPFDVVRIAKAIVENIDNKAPDLYELETLLRRVRELITGKRYLLVLDDVWTEDCRHFEPLISSLRVGASGSTVLVTTRSESVAKIMGCSNLLKLGVLSEKDCWDLFSQYAFSGRGKEDLKHLQAIGRKIANKCKGLPLTAKTIGSLMGFKTTVQEWQNVLDSDMWELEEAKKACLFPPLLFSYYALPPVLRRCFSYCAIFPKDSEIDADNLIKLWMAQGYLSSPGNTSMEATGRQSLDNLAMRCFLQDLKKDKGSANIVQFKMHDMVHDLAQYLTEKECSIMEVGSELKCRLNTPPAAVEIRHLTLVRSQDISFPSSIGSTSKLHTLWVQSFHDCPQLVSELDKISPEFFDRLLHLKVLDISRNRFQELPKEIGKLHNLRYLNLSHNPLVELPETMCELFNLQTLKLIACKHLERLPVRIGKLKDLRHLEMDRTDHLRKLPREIGRLRSLQTLTKFVLSSSKDDEETCNLGDLKDLNQLQGCLKLEGLGYVAKKADAEKAGLNKKCLVELQLDFKPQSVPSELTEEVIEALELPRDVQFLTMSFYRGAKFPSWIVSLNNLRKLKLQDCQSCTHLPPLGKLQALETLCIENMHGVKRIGAELLGVWTDCKDGKNANGVSAINIFPKLKKLKFKGMSSWEQWDVTGAERGVEEGNLRIMPFLQYLKLSGCSKLVELPEIFLQKAEIRKLRILKCPCLHQKYGNNTEEQWPKSHIQKIRISSN